MSKTDLTSDIVRIQDICWEIATKVGDGQHITDEESSKLERGLQWLRNRESEYPGRKFWIEQCIRRAGSVPAERVDGMWKLATGEWVSGDDAANFRMPFGKFKGLALAEIVNTLKGERLLSINEDSGDREWIDASGMKPEEIQEAVDEEGWIGVLDPELKRIKPFEWITDYDGVNYLDYLLGEGSKEDIRDTIKITLDAGDEFHFTEYKTFLKLGRKNFNRHGISRIELIKALPPKAAAKLKKVTGVIRGYLFGDLLKCLKEFMSRPEQVRLIQESLAAKSFDGRRQHATIEGKALVIDNETAPQINKIGENIGDTRVDISKWRNHGIPVWLSVEDKNGQVIDSDPSPWDTRGYTISEEEARDIESDDGWKESVAEEPDFNWVPAKPKMLTQARAWDIGARLLIEMQNIRNIQTREDWLRECASEKMESEPYEWYAGLPRPLIDDDREKLSEIAKEIRENLMDTVNGKLVPATMYRWEKKGEGWQRVEDGKVPERLITALRLEYKQAALRLSDSPVDEDEVIDSEMQEDEADQELVTTISDLLGFTEARKKIKRVMKQKKLKSAV